MPGRVILACEMIEDEVRLALESLPAEDRPPLVWVESGLHDRPERLQASLSEHQVDSSIMRVAKCWSMLVFLFIFSG